MVIFLDPFQPRFFTGTSKIWKAQYSLSTEPSGFGKVQFRFFLFSLLFFSVTFYEYDAYRRKPLERKEEKPAPSFMKVKGLKIDPLLFFSVTFYEYDAYRRKPLERKQEKPPFLYECEGSENRPFRIFYSVLGLLASCWDLKSGRSIFRPFPIFNPFPWPTSLSRKQVQKSRSLYFRTLWDFWPIPSAQFPRTIGLRPGSQIRKGLFSDCSGFSTCFLSLLASCWDFKSKMVYFQTLLDFRPSPLACQPRLGSQSKRVYFQTLLRFQPIPMAYWPWAGIWNLEGFIFRPFWIFNLFPRPVGLGLGSLIQKGLFSDPSHIRKTW